MKHKCNYGEKILRAGRGGGGCENCTLSPFEEIKVNKEQ